MKHFSQHFSTKNLSRLCIHTKINYNNKNNNHIQKKNNFHLEKTTKNDKQKSHNNNFDKKIFSHSFHKFLYFTLPFVMLPLFTII